MALFIVMIVPLLLGLAVIYIHGRLGIKRMLIPLLLLLIGNFIFLYAKFMVGDFFLASIYHLPAIFLVFVGGIWLLVLLINDIRRQANQKRILALLLALILTLIISFIPSLSEENKFKVYKKDYFQVSEAIFQAYDEGKLAVGERYHSPIRSSQVNLEKLKSDYSPDLIGRMERLHKRAGVYTYILADEDVIYFSFGAFFQSISGIAITRNGRELSFGDGVSGSYFDGATTYEYIEDGVYRFYDGL